MVVDLYNPFKQRDMASDFEYMLTTHPFPSLWFRVFSLRTRAGVQVQSEVFGLESKSLSSWLLHIYCRT